MRETPHAILALLAATLLAARGAEAAPDLVANGGLEKPDPADPTRPLGWDRPDGLGVHWAPAAAGGPDREHGRFILMDTRISKKDMVAQWRKVGLSQWDIPNADDNPVAATYGLSYYSEPFPVATGQAYRVSFDYRASPAGGGGKVWVRGYGEFAGRERRRYETIVFCRVESGSWTNFSQVFHPTVHTREVATLRVMLYAYWPAGEYAFDNVRVEPVPPAEYERQRRESEAGRAVRPTRPDAHGPTLSKPRQPPSGPAR